LHSLFPSGEVYKRPPLPLSLHFCLFISLPSVSSLQSDERAMRTMLISTVIILLSSLVIIDSTTSKTTKVGKAPLPDCDILYKTRRPSRPIFDRELRCNNGIYLFLPNREVSIDEPGYNQV
ncbi:hypothetical protein PMAYCL1PPCAC_04249, partial [Pristionchus mayeri]